MASIAPLISQEMKSFFYTLYGENSEIVQEDESPPIYTVPGKGISMTTDVYQGCHVIVSNQFKHDRPVVKLAIKQLVNLVTQTGTYTAVWVNILLPAKANITQILPGCFKVGNPRVDGSDLIKDDQKNIHCYWKWTASLALCTIPAAGATHNYGASKLLIDQTANKVFLVVDKYRPDHWELPGGSYDRYIDTELCDTAHREAQEEGGVKLDPASKKQAIVVTQMEFLKNRYARGIHQVWAIFADGMSEHPFFPQPSEIADAGWMDIDMVCKAEKVNGLALSKEIIPSIMAARSGHGLHRTFENPQKILYTASTSKLESLPTLEAADSHPTCPVYY